MTLPAACSWEPLSGLDLHHLPFLVFLLGGLLGWRFRRSKVLLSQLLLAVVYGLLLVNAPAGRPLGEASRALVAALALVLPLDLAWLFYRPEVGLVSRQGLDRLGLLLLQAGLVAAGLLLPGQLLRLLCFPVLPAGLLPVEPLSQPAAVLSAAVLLLLALMPGREPRAMRWGFFAALLLGSAALQGLARALADHGSLLQAGLLGAAGLGLVAGLVQLSYHLAYRDGLTGLLARRALEEELDLLRGTYSIAMVDVDRFKRFNDRHGHEVGDQILKMLASRLERISGGGRSFRYGGEEFALLFPGRTLEQVLPHLEELREETAAARLTLRARNRPRKKPARTVKPRKPARQLSATISIGVAESRPGKSTPREVLKAADKALYRAKRAGRNRVERS